jgi:hypothetical protein
MNTSHHEWLTETPWTDDIWLSMLVDGELSVSQRQQYVAHVAQTNDWQKVATAFLDEQVLEAHVAAPLEKDLEVAVDVSVGPNIRRDWRPYLGMAACLLFGLMMGPWLQSRGPSVEVVDVPVSSGAEPIDEEAGSVAKTEAAVLPSMPGLYQVSDTVDEAVYYADFCLPQFMLDALVLAGHRVTFDQEFLGYTETSDNPAAVPINVIHIQKYGRLLASLE